MTDITSIPALPKLEWIDKIPTRFRLNHFPQVPCDPFTREFDTLTEAVAAKNIIADYDLFLLENKHRVDFANVGVISYYRPDWIDPEDDSDDDGWYSIEDYEQEEMLAYEAAVREREQALARLAEKSPDADGASTDTPDAATSPTGHIITVSSLEHPDNFEIIEAVNKSVDEGVDIDDINNLYRHIYIDDEQGIDVTIRLSHDAYAAMVYKPFLTNTPVRIVSVDTTAGEAENKE